MKNYTAKEVAKKLRIGEGAVYERVKNGEIAKVPNMGRTVRIPASELKKFKPGRKETDYLTFDVNKVELIKTYLGDVRRIISTNEYLIIDIVKAIGLKDSYAIIRRLDEKYFRKIEPEELRELGLFAFNTGVLVITHKGIEVYSKKSRSRGIINFKKFLEELKPSNENVQVELEELKTDNSNALSKIFEGTPVEIITDKNGEPLFELYSTGMALGYITNADDKQYPHKTRIEKTLQNAEIKPFVHGVQKYLTEPMLYDFMFEAKTDKCKSFRKWVTNEVLPTIRKTGGYVNNTEKFTENYFSNLSEDTREIIKNELENKNKDLRLEKAKIEHELKSNTEIINLIDEA